MLSTLSSIFNRPESYSPSEIKVVQLFGDKVISCSGCRTHLTTDEECYSRAFMGNSGRSYLFNFAVNITLGEKVSRNLMTGRHDVRDVFCLVCDKYLGWKYDAAAYVREQYKVGKYILELKHIYYEEEKFF